MDALLPALAGLLAASAVAFVARPYETPVETPTTCPALRIRSAGDCASSRTLIGLSKP
jgi:hypothetical protein